MIKSKAGFTLIEILVVVIIIGILAATALLYYGRFIERMRMTEALQLFGTVLAAQERNMLKKYRYTDQWEYLDVIPMQLSTGGLNPKYYDTDRKVYFTNGSGPDGDSGIGSFRPGYKVYFITPDASGNSSRRWFVKAERIGGGVYSEHYYLIRAFDDTKIYCIPDGEHADSVTLCMDFMGVSTEEELESDPMTASAALGPHDNLASAGKSGAGSSATPTEQGEPASGNSDVEGEGANNSSPDTLDVEGDTNEGGENATNEPVTNNDAGGSPAPAEEEGPVENNSGNTNEPESTGNNAPEVAPSTNSGNDTPEITPDTNAGNSGDNTGSGNNENPNAGSGDNSGNPNAGPGNNSGGANSGNPNAGSGNNSGSGNGNNSGSGSGSNWLKDAACTVAGWFGIKC